MRKTTVYISKDILLYIYILLVFDFLLVPNKVDLTYFLQEPIFLLYSNIIVLLFFIILLVVINL